MQRNSGFTLIELLIVIAIIGILAGLILLAVGNTRERSEDIRVKSSIRQIRVLAESYFTANNNNYAGFDTCVSSPSLVNCLDQATSDNITLLVADVEDANAQGGSLDVAASNAGFCVTAPLRSQPTDYICADTSGQVYEGTAGSSPCGGAQPVCTY